MHSLSDAFTHRLAQLGLSRRAFAARSGLSRQTLHNIEIECRVDLAPSTFAALDQGLHWPTGKAWALAHGQDVEANETDTEERANAMRWVIVQRISSMPLEDLETMVFQWADNNGTDAG